MTPHPPSPSSPEYPEQPEHPDIEELADLAEGLLPEQRAAGLRSHLAGCPECADSHAALAELSGLLAAQGAADRAMPAEVADRLDAALAAEAAARSVTATPISQPGPSTPPTSRTGSAPPGRTDAAARPPGPGRPRSRRRAGRVLLATAALAGVLTLGSVLVQQSGHPESTGASTADAKAIAPQSAASGAAAPSRLPATAPALPEYRADRLATQARSLLAPRPSAALGAEVQEPGTPEPDGRIAAADVPGCVTEAAGHPGQAPLAAAAGRYDGSPVTLLVYPAADRSGRLDVLLTTPTCPGATVLLTQTVPAP